MIMEKIYKKILEEIFPLLSISLFLILSFALNGQEDKNLEEIIVKGNVLYSDQEIGRAHV